MPSEEQRPGSLWPMLFSFSEFGACTVAPLPGSFSAERCLPEATSTAAVLTVTARRLLGTDWERSSGGWTHGQGAPIKRIRWPHRRPPIVCCAFHLSCFGRVPKGDPLSHECLRTFALPYRNFVHCVPLLPSDTPCLKLRRTAIRSPFRNSPAISRARASLVQIP